MKASSYHKRSKNSGGVSYLASDEARSH